ncbi:TPA: hypothetical protein EYN09_23785, partial [Candidatus Poribacteria bacterium]|nr:hypothetical protein [Candidatus Poribacteria bacterium]HIO09943.1 hypothetical protein [Candidatus Poribacteria bacterium]HIO78322.1 hypothetical protein [Candidatus Poribacteria bacterium]
MSRKIEVWEVAISIFLVTGFLMADGQADIEGNTDQLRLRAELQRLESELKRISNPEQLEVEENFQQQKDTPARVREIQQRIGKIQGIQSQPGRKVSVPTKEQLDKIIANLRVEINKANKPIEKVAELAPGSEELRMLRRRLSHKKRVLHWRISQRNWLETQEEKKLQQLDPEGEKTSPSSEQIEVVLDELSIDPTEFNQSEDTSFHNR